MSLIFGGSEVQMLETAKSLTKLGVTVEFLDFNDRDQFERADILHLFSSEYVFRQIVDLSNAKNIPVVTSSIYYPVGLQRAKDLWISKVPLSTENLRRKILERSSFILPNSVSEARLLLEMYNLKTPMRVIPNGINENILNGDALYFRDKYISRWGNEKFILSVGRIEDRKNSLNLLKAARQEDIPILFIGRPNMTQEKYIADFFREAKKHGERFIHIPFLEPNGYDLRSAFAACHSHALVSWLETPGIASLEAGACGANLVVGRCPPVEEYLGGFSEIVNQKDIDSIASGLRNSIGIPKDNYGQSQHIKTRFTWDRVARLNLELYKELLNGRF